MTNEEELAQLEMQLKKQYLAIADRYKFMSKVNDKIRLDAIQSGIDHDIANSLTLREKIEALRKEKMDAWATKSDKLTGFEDK